MQDGATVQTAFVWQLRGAGMMTFAEHWATLADKNPGLRKEAMIRIRTAEL
jgi:hypothetical protein